LCSRGRNQSLTAPHVHTLKCTVWYAAWYAVRYTVLHFHVLYFAVLYFTILNETCKVRGTLCVYALFAAQAASSRCLFVFVSCLLCQGSCLLDCALGSGFSPPFLVARGQSCCPYEDLKNLNTGYV
ncbi:unnamed protein product, partial [Discosporangium mesarthrocarpum]